MKTTNTSLFCLLLTLAFLGLSSCAALVVDDDDGGKVEANQRLKDYDKWSKSPEALKPVVVPPKPIVAPPKPIVKTQPVATTNKQADTTTDTQNGDMGGKNEPKKDTAEKPAGEDKAPAKKPVTKPDVDDKEN
jgi:hypothetical protein